MRIPRSHPAFGLSEAQAYVKGLLPAQQSPSHTVRWFFCRSQRICVSDGRYGGLAGIHVSTADVVTNLSFPVWLRFSGGFHDSCVLVANPLQKSITCEVLSFVRGEETPASPTPPQGTHLDTELHARGSNTHSHWKLLMCQALPKVLFMYYVI